MKKDIRDYKRNGKQYAYILDAICTENFDTTANSDKELIQFFFNTFNKEYNYSYNKKRYRNLQARISSYLKGLPSCINIAYTYTDIEKLLISFGYDLKGYRLTIALNEWFDVLALRLIQLANYYNINLDVIY